LPAIDLPCATVRLGTLCIAAGLIYPTGHGGLLKATTYRQLQTPVKGGVALRWGVERGPNDSVRLTHAGNNDLWFASITLWPQHTLTLIATNSGNDAAEKMVLDLRFVLAKQLKLVE